MNKLGVVTGSLLGACALHFVLAACGSSSPAGSNASGTPDAHAQTSPAATACSKWQVAQFYTPSVLSRTNGTDWPTGVSAQIDVPDGWEPMGETVWGGATTNNTTTTGVLVFIRKCAQ